MDLSSSVPKDESPAAGMGLDARRMPPETFGIFIDDDRYAVPTLHPVEDAEPTLTTPEPLEPEDLRVAQNSPL